MTHAKNRRMQRFLNRENGRGIFLPIDHGLTCGPLSGIETTKQIAALIDRPEINGIIAHKGVIERLYQYNDLSRVGVLLHVNGMPLIAQDSDQKEFLSSLETASRLGVDGVSLQINFNGLNDAFNVKMLGAIKDAAMKFDLPVLTMLYDKTPQIDQEVKITRLRHLLRIVIELGSDFVKVALPDNAVIMEEAFANLSDDIPIFVAGGSSAYTTDQEIQLLAKLTQAIDFGARGFCIGRNIFENKNPALFLQKLARIGKTNVKEVFLSRGALVQ